MTKSISLVILLAVLSMASCTRISPTEAGFKVSNSGDYRGVDSLPLLTGWQFYFPGVSSVMTIPTTQQHVVWTESDKEGNGDNEEIKISCLGGSGFAMDIGLNYTVEANKASKIYLKWGTDDLESITNSYLRNATRRAMQDVSGTITMDSILNNLPGFEHAASDRLSAAIEPYGFRLDLFSVVSAPRPTDPNIAKSINQKIKARQDAETSIMQLQQSIAEANKQIAVARGDSASKVINALGDAEAIRVKQQVITPEYIEFTKWSNWDGHLPTYMMGGGTPLINLK